MTTTKNPCTLCGKPGIPGLISGAGKCQYHYNVGQFGKAWADYIYGQTPEGQLAKAAAEMLEAAKNDLKMHQDHGADVNPFSTQGGRATWQQGWDGTRPANMVDGSVEWRYWERGRQARILHDAMPQAVC